MDSDNAISYVLGSLKKNEAATLLPGWEQSCRLAPTKQASCGAVVLVW